MNPTSTERRRGAAPLGALLVGSDEVGAGGATLGAGIATMSFVLRLTPFPPSFLGATTALDGGGAGARGIGVLPDKLTWTVRAPAAASFCEMLSPSPPGTGSVASARASP